MTSTNLTRAVSHTYMCNVVHNTPVALTQSSRAHILWDMSITGDEKYVLHYSLHVDY